MNFLLEKNLPTWKINDPTKVSQFISCPRSYFFSYVLGWRPEVPANHLAFGSAWHLAVEHLLLNGYTKSSVIDAYDLFLRDYRKTFGPEQDELFEPKSPENALIALNAYSREFEQDLKLWRPLYTEIAGKINLNEDQVLYFRMDSIMEKINGGKIKSIEHKTGSYSYNWEMQWPLSMQNGTYSHVLYCLFEPELVEGVVFRGTMFRKVKKGWEQLRSGQKLTVQPPYEFIEYPAKRSLDQMNDWLWHAQLYLDQISFCFEMLADCKEEDLIMRTFPKNPTSCTKYNGCEFFDYCNAWHNPLRRCHEPPIGYKEEHWDPSSKPAKKTFEIGGDNG